MPRSEREMETIIRENARQMKQADAVAARARDRWEKSLAEGNTQYGITYDRCAELSKLSRSRIDQVLRKLRTRKEESNHASV